MKNRDTIKSIPLGDVKCIWMTAGALDYKLCNRNYDCDSCEFYYAMRRDMSSSASVPMGDHSGDSAIEFGDRILSILKNYNLKTGLLYKENHTWIRVVDSEKVQVGLDAFAANLLPKNKTIVLPVTGNYIEQDSPCGWITVGESTYTIKSPVSGFVTDVNYDLIRSSDIINSSPYQQGWLFYVKPSGFLKEEKHLLKYTDMRRITENDIEKITRKIFSDHELTQSSVGQTMMDGGAPLTHLFDILGPKRFGSVLSCIFKFFV